MFKPPSVDVKLEANLDKPLVHRVVIDPQTLSQARVLVEDAMIATGAVVAATFAFKTISEIAIHIVKTKVK